MQRLFAFLELPFDADALTKLARPSATSRKDSAVVAGGDLVEAWRRSVTDEELAATMRVVELFGLDTETEPEDEAPGKVTELRRHKSS